MGYLRDPTSVFPLGDLFGIATGSGHKREDTSLSKRMEDRTQVPRFAPPMRLEQAC